MHTRSAPGSVSFEPSRERFVTHRDAVERRLGLAPGERMLAAARAQRRGTSMIIGIAAGVGGGIGYVVATSDTAGVLRAALGGGIGAGSGAVIGWVVVSMWLRGEAGLGPLLSLAVTNDRFVALRRSAITNTPTDVVASVPIGDVVDLAVGPSRLVFARTLRVVFGNGTAWDLEVTRPERPEQFLNAYREALRGPAA